MTYTLHRGDCLEVMATLPDASVDAIVTDPPYGLSFMGKHWDHGVPGEAFWCEAMRVAKPGAHLLAFGGSRTYHRLAVAIEDAGWEIRDCVMWLYGSGFPKSHDVSKAIDKAAGAEREVVGDKLDRPGYHLSPGGGTKFGNGNGLHGHREDARLRAATVTAPATPDAHRWQGWGTALKPAHEPIILARKPFKGTVAGNVLEHGCGALNVDGCRINYVDEADCSAATPQGRVTSKNSGSIGATPDAGRNESRVEFARPEQKGRWPANVILSEGVTDEAWSRFFYCPKASKADRDAGLVGMPVRESGAMVGNMTSGQRLADNGTPIKTPKRSNHHPTVKPTDLMRYLCRLITPPGGEVLDPFMGSGSTGKAAMLEGFGFVGIEREQEYIDIARRRIEAACGDLPLLRGTT